MHLINYREANRQNHTFLASLRDPQRRAAPHFPRLPAVLRTYHALRAKVTGTTTFWNAMPPKIREWQGLLSAATSKLHEFLNMDDEERGCRIERVEGAVTHLINLKPHSESVMRLPLKNIDVPILSAHGFRFEEKVKICRSCLGVARARGGRCCAAYSISNRFDRDVIHDMLLAKTCPIAPRANNEEEGEGAIG